MVHLQNKSYTPKDATTLLYKARELVEPEIILRDVRVSRKYVELDTSIPDGMDLNTLVSKLSKISPLANYEHIIERHMRKDEAIEQAVKLFNDEKYWGAHEALESIWKGSTGSERSTLNGIILVAAAFVHDEKDEQEICLSILERARKKLEGAGSIYYGIDVGRIDDLISRILKSRRIERFTI